MRDAHRHILPPPYDNERDPTLFDKVAEVLAGFAIGGLIVAIAAVCALELRALMNPWS